MAYTSVIPVGRLDRTVAYVRNKDKISAAGAGSLSEAIGYALNRDKTETQLFETALECACDTAFEDMLLIKRRFRKNKGVQGFHMVQSFAEGEVTPELAHRIGVEFAERHLRGEYQAVITTHLNTSHIHNHLVWNSVNRLTGKKYHSNSKSYFEEVRELSDSLCKKYGLSVIPVGRETRYSMPYPEWQAERDGKPVWRTAIRQDVDDAIRGALTWRQFVRALEAKGYKMVWDRKHPTLQPPGKPRPVRFKTLGLGYTPEAIRLRILYPQGQPQPGQPTVRRYRLRGQYRPRKLHGLLALYYRYLYELGAMPSKPRRQSYAVRQDITRLDRYIRQYRFLQQKSLNSAEAVAGYQAEAQARIAALSAENRRRRRGGETGPQRDILMAQLKVARQEARLCDEILSDHAQMEQRLKERHERQNQEQNQTHQKKKGEPTIEQ